MLTCCIGCLIQLTSALGSAFNLPSVATTAVILVCLNSSLNSLLYCWRDLQIRTTLMQLFAVSFIFANNELNTVNFPENTKWMLGEIGASEAFKPLDPVI